MKKVCTYLMLLALLFALGASALLRQQHLASQIIRLHILANSDTEADQAAKFAVRDALLPEIEMLTADCTVRAEAAAALIENSKRLGQLAAQTAGKRVTLRLSPEQYPTRRYDGFSLPAGEYLSLQIGIGEAAGRNWWCVAFPSVCTAAAAADFEAVAVSGGLRGDDLRMMTEEEPDVKVRYLLLELISRLQKRF